MRIVSSIFGSLSLWTYASWLATFVVFIGVFGEVVAEFTDWIKSEHRKKRLNRFSAFVLVVGLVLELLTLVMTSILADSEIAALNNDTVRLQEKLAFRHLTPEQAATLTTKLVPLAKHEIQVFAQSRDFEASAFASQLKWVFKAAGINTKLGLGVQFAVAYSGVLVESTNDPESQRLASNILVALLSEKIVAAQVVLKDGPGQSPLVRVSVGSKPTGNQVQYMTADP